MDEPWNSIGPITAAAAKGTSMGRTAPLDTISASKRFHSERI